MGEGGGEVNRSMGWLVCLSVCLFIFLLRDKYLSVVEEFYYKCVFNFRKRRMCTSLFGS